MNNKIILPIFVLLLVFGVFSFVQLEKNKVESLDCSKSPDVYYLTPSEKSNIQPILNSNENALVVIPETNEIRANSKLLECPGIDLMQYIDGGFEW